MLEIHISDLMDILTNMEDGDIPKNNPVITATGRGVMNYDVTLFAVVTQKTKSNKELEIYGYYLDRKVAEKDVSKLASLGVRGVIFEYEIITA